MEDNLSVRISVPKLDLAALTICSSTANALADWVAALPMANTAPTASQLANAANEVGRLQCDASQRLAMLEHLRPPIHYICTRLDRAALTNSNQGDAIAAAAQQLQMSLITGYKSVVRDGLKEWQDRSQRSSKDDLATAVHRTLADMSRTMLRTFQLYVTPPDDMWLELNQLYFLAEQLRLEDTQVNDSENHNRETTSIGEAYLRAVMLSLAKPNQLRYESLSHIFNALELWGSRTFVEPIVEESLFRVDLAQDRGPMFTRLLPNPKEGRSIRCDVLVYEIEAYLKEIDSSVPIPDYIDESLLSHLVSAWGSIAERSFKRLQATDAIKVVVGLRAAHYFISGGVEFADQVGNSDTMLRREINPFGDRQNEVTMTQSTGRSDVWENAHDVGGKIPINPNISDPERILSTRIGTASERAKAERTSTFRYYNTHAVDTSPGGYCIRWVDALPNNIQTGELMALRDETDPRWCLAVARWIRQDQDGSTMGIELLAPRAIAVATRVIQKKGGPTDFTRAFLLPELKPINQPATLITPKVPFASEQKIHLHRQGVQTTAQLGTCLLKTESFNQFTFRMLDGYLENAQINLNIQSLSEMIGAQEPGEPK